MSTTPGLAVDEQLPIAAVADEVCAALHEGNVVLQAQPGAGKSTALPLALLKAGFEGKILLLEPRRLAAQNVAARLAWQLGEKLGQTVGLRMRGRSEVSRRTKLEVVTEGVLTRILQNDPLLEGVSLVVFDEFHERSLHADLGLALCLDVQRGLREDLRLLLMSATLDGAQLCHHLGVEAPIVCTVRQHPVEVFWQSAGRDPLPQSVARVTIDALKDHEGDALVFLPGVAEIEKTARLLVDRLPEGVVLHKLHGGAANSQQRAATASKGALRRVILSTSIAETSITIDGVCIVVDSGVERRSKIDVVSGVERLETVMASQASATQRAGRAGRVESGVCYRLWSESTHSRRTERWQPEILRAELSALMLELGQWGVADVKDLPWIDAPPEAALERAIKLLQILGLWKGHTLTEHGRAAAKLPLHPRLAHMLLWASQRGALDTASLLAALLEDKPRQQSADLSISLQSASTQCKQRAEQLRQLLRTDKSTGLAAPSAAAILAQAFPDRIAKRRPGLESRYLLSSGSGAVLNNDDSLAQCDYLIAADLGGASQEARIFLALEIHVQELEQWSADLILQSERVDWNDRQERVVAESQRCIGAIVLDAKPMQKIDADLRAKALIAALRHKGLHSLHWNENTLEWKARVTRMRELQGDACDYPAVDDDSLLASLEQWLQPWLGNTGSFKALAQIDLQEALDAMLDYGQKKKLDVWFPQRYTVPSGSQHQLRYACEGNPVLAVKLQEMFGCRDNPAVAEGRLTLKVELLSPARRPVQITEDLANFWHNSYPAVKKELAGRYPKHPWPDDPINAEATARVKPRKR